MAFRRGLACLLLVACGGSTDGGEGGTAGAAPSGAGGAGGAACVCSDDAAYADKLCFCEDAGFGCSADISIDRVLEPLCPGSLIHPISPSCKVGGVLYPPDEASDLLSEAFYFDRDTGELVGLYASAEGSDLCSAESATVRWGDVAASCELCDPCGDNPDFPACPEPAP